MAEQIGTNFGGMVGLPGRAGWGLVEDPGHEQIRTFGELGGIAQFGDATEKTADPGDATALVSGNGNVSADRKSVV